jgi:hypothetical protein
MEIVAFVEAQLPPIPARVLEIGCGEGELARAVARLGYLYAELGGARVEREERDLIEAETIRAVGFNYVGEI